jgi:hypothetical protein
MSKRNVLDSEGTKRLRKRMASLSLAVTSKDNNDPLSVLLSTRMR